VTGARPAPKLACCVYAAPVTDDSTRETVLAWVARWTPEGVERLDELVGPGYVHLAMNGHDLDLAGFKAGLLAVLASFPDMVYRVRHVVAQDGMAAVYLGASGTHKGSYLGVAPTGEAADFTGAYHARVVGGQIVEDWDVFDLLTPVLRLGARIVPPPHS